MIFIFLFFILFLLKIFCLRIHANFTASSRFNGCNKALYRGVEVLTDDQPVFQESNDAPVVKPTQTVRDHSDARHERN